MIAKIKQVENTTVFERGAHRVTSTQSGYRRFVKSLGKWVRVECDGTEQMFVVLVAQEVEQG